MRLSFAISILVAASFVAYAESPRITAVDPQNGKVGDVITITGENLQKDSVAKVYLTDGTNDIQVDAITEQTATSIKFKIPDKAKPGRLALMFLTAGKAGQLMEQPYKITIDEP
ncbi:MAG TPA: IPT/TIG domain-containing protein [Bryobacteraceae bacterium]|nr:IPT/TIG domain-containing protein [Bryobacteraceae bacterium]